MASEYRLANFANPWVRTPGVVYGIYPLTHLDSADLTYRFDSAAGTLSLNAGYGWVDYPIPIKAENADTAALDIDNVVYANLKLDNGPWRFKLSWLRGDLTIQADALDQAIAGVAVFDPVAALALQPDRIGVSLYSAGFSYESDDWLLMSEWGMGLLDRPSLLNSTHGGYFTLGYHFDRWLPHITVGYQASTDARVHSPLAFIDSALANSHRVQRTDYRTLAIGLNYAATDSVILRGQVDLIESMRFSQGPYLNHDATYRFDAPGVDALFSLSLDFVY